MADQDQGRFDQTLLTGAEKVQLDKIYTVDQRTTFPGSVWAVATKLAGK
jgi:hypothetical protein